MRSRAGALSAFEHVERAADASEVLKLQAREVTAELRVSPVLEMPLSDIDVSGDWNPRGSAGTEAYTPERLSGLMAAIAAYGQQLPCLVRPSPGVPGRFQLVYGWRRYHARRLSGDAALSVQVREVSDELLPVLSALENTQREELDQFETMRGVLRALASLLGKQEFEMQAVFNRVVNTGEDPDDVAGKLAALTGHSLVSFAKKYVRVLLVSPAEMRALYTRQVTHSVVLELTRLKDDVAREPMLERAVNESWTTAVTAAEVSKVLAGRAGAAATRSSPSSTVRAVAGRLTPRYLKAQPEERRLRIEALIRELGALTLDA